MGDKDGIEFVSFRCPECNKKLRVAAKHAGRQVPCPRCGERIRIPTKEEAQVAEQRIGTAASTGEPNPHGGRPPGQTPSRKTPSTKSATITMSTVASQPEADELAAEVLKQQPKTISLDDQLKLSTPAITDLEERLRLIQAAKQAREEEKRQQPAKRSLADAPKGTVEPIKPGRLKRPSTSQPAGTGARASQSDVGSSKQPPAPGSTSGQEPLVKEDKTSPTASTSSASPTGSESAPPRSVFDDELPDLEPLEVDATGGNKEGSTSADDVSRRPGGRASGRSQTDDDADSLKESDAGPDDWLDALDDALPSLYDDGTGHREGDDGDEYRVICSTCGTAQYVPLAAVGMKAKCPDCFSEFKIPPPPPAVLEQIKKKKKQQKRPPETLDDDDDIPRFKDDDDGATREKGDALEHQHVKELLSRAERELTEEEKKQAYIPEFDAQGFFERTFGFLADPIVISQIVGYGLVYAILAALLQFSLSHTEGYFGRGLLLISYILSPVIIVLFAMPMISGGLLLIESVANKQARQEALPSFNIFDNFSELVLFAVAIGVSAAPGFILGGLLAGEGPGVGYYRLLGTMTSFFFLFPVILLSMLDGERLTSILTTAVVNSIAQAREAWAAYYFKTFVGYAFFTLLWMVVLAMGPAGTAVVGATIPLLFFFTCQQLGLLADDIGDILSVHFASEEPEKESGETDEGDEAEDLDDLEG